METRAITFERTVSIWWSLAWRAALGGALAGFVMSALGWLTVSLLGFPQLGALVGGVLAVLAFLPVSMWALYAALNKSHRSYAVVLVRPL